ncbi:MAG: hypothetical protein U0T84_13170 [Chitinophagales bacterium]
MYKQLSYLLVFAVLLIAGCKKKESNPNVLKQTIKLHGTVVDQDMKPLTGAIVVFGSKTFISNNGFYVFDEVTMNAGRQVVKASMPGYFEAAIGFEATQKASAQVRIVLVKKNLSGTVDATTGGTVGSSAQVVLPAGGLQNSDGSAFSGTANLFTYHFNPGDANFSRMTPGGDLNARSSSGTERQLMSYGMIAVKMEDASGNQLEVASGKTATVKLPIDASQLATAPATIKLWHLNETTGIWEEEGTATKQGSFYVGTVTHFSTWNTDRDEDVAWVKGKVVDCNGNVISSADANVADATPGSGNRPQNGIQLENQGLFIMRVASGFPLTVTVYPYGDRSNPVTASIPALSPGQTYDIGTVVGPCGSKATGTLIDGSGNPVSGMVHVESGDYQTNVDVWNGQMSLDLALNKTYTITPYCMSGAIFGDSKTVTTGSSPGTQSLGNITTCPANGTGNQADISQCFFTANGGTFSNQSFRFNTTGSSGIAVYSPTDTLYAISISGTVQGGSDNLQMTITLHGNSAGTYTIDNGNDAQGYATVICQQYNGTAQTQRAFTGTSGTVSLVSVGTTGQTVKGTFTGTFDYSDNSGTQQSISVTGSFNTIRFQ